MPLCRGRDPRLISRPQHFFNNSKAEFSYSFALFRAYGLILFSCSFHISRLVLPYFTETFSCSQDTISSAFFFFFLTYLTASCFVCVCGGGVCTSCLVHIFLTRRWIRFICGMLMHHNRRIPYSPICGVQCHLRLVSPRKF